MTQIEAVFQACEEIDVHSSVRELQARAEVIYGGDIHYCAVVTYRSKYKKQNKVKADCRTYRGQPRRNMLNDHSATLGQVKRIKHVLGLRRVLPESLLNLLGDGKDAFHSVEQLRNAVDELISLRAAA